MSALPWIAAALAGGGLYLWWKSRQKAAQPSGPSSACVVACQAAAVGGVPSSACLAACDALGNVLGYVNPFHNSGDDHQGEYQRRIANNDGLNGAKDVPNNMPLYGATSILTSPTSRYKNGCVPYFDAPGFAKCAQGTLDMYGSAIDAATGYEYGYTEQYLVSEPAYLTWASRQSALASVQNTVDANDHWYQLNLKGTQLAGYPTRHLNKNALMTGHSGDALTVGPLWKSGSTVTWLVRGKKATGVEGSTAPRAVVMQAWNREDMIDALSDEQAAEAIDIASDPGVTHTGGGCANGMPTIPGTTWDPSTSSWRRQTVAEALAGTPINPGPCAGALTINVADVLSHGLEFK